MLTCMVITCQKINFEKQSFTLGACHHLEVWQCCGSETQSHGSIYRLDQRRVCPTIPVLYQATRPENKINENKNFCTTKYLRIAPLNLV